MTVIMIFDKTATPEYKGTFVLFVSLSCSTFFKITCLLLVEGGNIVTWICSILLGFEMANWKCFEKSTFSL